MAAGAGAGVVSALVFTSIHQLIISPIWFALWPMLGAGAVCGASLAWSYRLAVPAPAVTSWMRYNLFYLVMFVALGLVSLAVFEPVTTIGTLLNAKEPPRELIGRALPMTGAFALATAAALSAIYRPGWRGAGAILVTTVVMLGFLGLNISTLGLVEVPTALAGVLAEVFVLLVAIIGVYAILVAALMRGSFQSRSECRSRP